MQILAGNFRVNAHVQDLDSDRKFASLRPLLAFSGALKVVLIATQQRKNLILVARFNGNDQVGIIDSEELREGLEHVQTILLTA